MEEGIYMGSGGEVVRGLKRWRRGRDGDLKDIGVIF
jgi:hypothetical protein